MLNWPSAAARFRCLRRQRRTIHSSIHRVPLGQRQSLGERACYDESKRLGETITMEFGAAATWMRALCVSSTLMGHITRSTMA
jgi:hypothetical protein